MRLLVLSLLLGVCSGARILGLLPMPSQSHSILLERLMRQLSAKGHHITYITATKPSSMIANMEVIEVPGIRDAMMSAIQKAMGLAPNETFSFANKKGPSSPWMMPFMGALMAEPMTDHILSNTGVQKLLASNDKFDLILGEIMMDEAILAGLSYRFKAPIVAFATFKPNIFANYLVGNPSPAAFVPDSFLDFGPKMTFWERVENFLFGVLMEAVHLLRNLPNQDVLMRKYFGQDAPYIGEILKNTSLVLVNDHHSLGFPRPYLPNMVEVAGVHINDPKPLPKDLQTFMDNSKKGAIFFSLGSNVNSSDLAPEKISAILKGFAKLEQNVLWKFETELSPLPKNVKVMKWVPQSDILAHPNLKLFITHGGMLSTTEALTRAVPVVGIPIMGDQHANMKMTRDSGWGLLLKLEDVNEDTLYQTVTEVINNPKYKAKVMEKSAIFNDNPMSALDRATWWIDYVIRHKGAHHLRSAAQDLAWHQIYLLDVYALVIALMLPIVALNFCITRALFRKICGIFSCRSKSVKTTNKTEKSKKSKKLD